MTTKSGDPLIEEAYLALEEFLSKPNGRDMFYVSNIIYMLTEEELPLSRDEIALLAGRIVEASGTSVVPILTAERVDAVRALLEYGITETRSPEFPETSPDDMKNILLSCDMDIFTEIVDTVAIDNQRYYAPDNDYALEVEKQHQRATNAILQMKSGHNPDPLCNQIQSATARTQSEEPTPITNANTKEPELGL